MKKKNIHIVKFCFQTFLIDPPFEKKPHKFRHLVNGYLAFLTEFLRSFMRSIRHEPKNFLLIYFGCRIHDNLLMRSKQFLLSSSKFTFVSACPNLDSVSSFLFLSNNSPALTEWTPIASVWNVILCQLSDNHSKWITWNRHELHCLLLLAFVQHLGFNFYSGQLGAFHIIS